MSKKVNVLDTKGKTVGEITLSDEMLKVKADPSLVHQAVRYELALERQGSASTRGRSEVSGGGAKPWRQKGTGRARAGSIRSPLWKGGGVVFGPVPRDFAVGMPKKARRQALKVVLTEKIKGGAVKVVEKFDWKSPSTKRAAETLRSVQAAGKVLVVLQGDNEIEEKSLRNIPEVKITRLGQVNTYDVLDSDSLVLTKDVFQKLVEERLS